MRAFFACGGREKSKNSPVCALAHAQATGLCDYTFKSRHSETKTGGVCPLLLFGRSGETCEHFSLAGDAKNQRIRQCAHWLMHRPPACAITHSSLATVKQKQGAFAPCFCLVGVARLASIFRLRGTRKIKEFASVRTGSCTGHRPVRLHIQVSPQ